MSYVLIVQTTPLTTSPVMGTGNNTQGQSFTFPMTFSPAQVYLKMITVSIGGNTPSVNLAGIQATTINIRKWVNNVETNNPPGCFSGTLLATSGYGSQTGTGNSVAPESTFIFSSPVHLIPGNKYVIETTILSTGVGVYVIDNSSYPDGQAYDAPGGINLSTPRELILRLEGIIGVYEPLTNTDFQNALIYYFSGGSGTLPGGNNSSNIQVMDIANWDTSAITSMNKAFENRGSFNEDIGNWNTSNVTNMSEMFSDATIFNQNIGNWNVENVNDFSALFKGATNFNQNIGSWNVENVNDFSALFNGATSFNQNIGNWNVSSATNMQSMFEGASSFNQDISTRTVSGGEIVWDVSGVENIQFMFKEASSFNNSDPSNNNIHPMNWTTTKIVGDKMKELFHGASSFNQSVNTLTLDDGRKVWDVSGVTDFQFMFKDAESFDGNLHWWRMHDASNLTSMFEGATVFNSLLYNWNTSNVKEMSSMFKNAQYFNQYINTGYSYLLDYKIWDVSNVSNFEHVFDGALRFNKYIGDWETKNATSMGYMFKNAVHFNQDLSKWFEPGKLDNMVVSSNCEDENDYLDLYHMFSGAIRFLQFTRNWTIPTISGGSLDYDICIDGIFSGAEDMSRVFYPCRDKTGFGDTPENNFFNYKYDLSYSLDIGVQDRNQSEIVITKIGNANYEPIEDSSLVQILPYNLAIKPVTTNMIDSSYTIQPFDEEEGELALQNNIHVKLTNYEEYNNVSYLITVPFYDDFYNRHVFDISATFNISYSITPEPEPEPEPHTNKRKHACKKPKCLSYMENPETQGNFFSGNTNQPNFMAVKAFKNSNILRTSSIRRNKQRRDLRVGITSCGQSHGTPGGFGGKLSNKF